MAHTLEGLLKNGSATLPTTAVFSPFYITCTVKNDKAHKHNPKIHKIMKLSSNSINPPVDVYYRANTDEKFLIPPLNALSLTSDVWIHLPISLFGMGIFQLLLDIAYPNRKPRTIEIAGTFKDRIFTFILCFNFRYYSSTTALTFLGTNTSNTHLLHRNPIFISYTEFEHTCILDKNEILVIRLSHLSLLFHISIMN